MDMIGLPLLECAQILQTKQLPFIVKVTKPVPNRVTLAIDNYYAIRQRLVDGIYQLTVAAKMT